ncbi:acyl-CoA-like ligand-binding transcription factor [Actinomadura roseirufa]|uniref:acyl-CoA-like ligand-binding transcription factor n=1 Tax=Actinomadura roseirufa TaxID=2094049 RepID=UPI001040EC75|nr:TetR family transcriptional regulator [Actinomadura roseirufa]
MSTPLPDHLIDRLQDRFALLPLRERKKLKTRRAIQDHALRLFGEQGYDETTVEQIAAAAEISPSTFFRYFPTKEDVVVTDEYDPIMAQMFRAQPPGMSPLEALRAVFRELLPLMYESEMETITTRLRLTASVPAVRARTFESMHDGTLRVLKEITAERVGRPGTDPEVEAFTWAVVGVLQAALYRWLDGEPLENLPALIDRNLDFLGRGCPL